MHILIQRLFVVLSHSASLDTSEHVLENPTYGGHEDVHLSQAADSCYSCVGPSYDHESANTAHVDSATGGKLK